MRRFAFPLKALKGNWYLSDVGKSVTLLEFSTGQGRVYPGKAYRNPALRRHRRFADGPVIVVSITGERIMHLSGCARQLVVKRNVTINPKDWITLTTAAKMRGVTRQAISRLVQRGNLGVVEIDGQRFVRRSEVARYKPRVGGRPKQN